MVQTSGGNARNSQHDVMTDRPKYASPPCMAAEVDPTYFDPLGVDPEQARDVARWRRAERQRLSVLRAALGQAGRQKLSETICSYVATLLATKRDLRRAVVAGYWPIRNEPDLRPLLSDLHNAGAIIALPVVETRAAPLVFRRWTPGMRLEHGHWNIPVPPQDAEPLTPEYVFAPCLGWDEGCFRLGWGGGYYDRTLASLSERPYCIGIALTAAQLPTIYPQPHDIPLDVIVTETGVLARRNGAT